MLVSAEEVDSVLGMVRASGFLDTIPGNLRPDWVPKGSQWVPVASIGGIWMSRRKSRSGVSITSIARHAPPHSLDLDLDLLSYHIQSGRLDLSLPVGLVCRFAGILPSGSASPMPCFAGMGDAAVCVWATAFLAFGSLVEER